MLFARGSVGASIVAIVRVIVIVRVLVVGPTERVAVLCDGEVLPWAADGQAYTG